MDVEDDNAPRDEPESRQPSVEDLRDLCRHLNDCGARYVVIDGYAMRAAGYDRATMDIDLLIDTSPENEAKVFRALESLPDKAVSELNAGDVAKYVVVRVADEIVIDLMGSAAAIEYAEAAKETVTTHVGGIPVPFASPRLLWRMKKSTHRERDVSDLLFLRDWFRSRGEQPPE